MAAVDEDFLCRNDRILRLHRLNRPGDEPDDDVPSESAPAPVVLHVSSADDESDESLLLLLPPSLLLLLDQKPDFPMVPARGARVTRESYGRRGGGLDKSHKPEKT